MICEQRVSVIKLKTLLSSFFVSKMISTDSHCSLINSQFEHVFIYTNLHKARFCYFIDSSDEYRMIQTTTDLSLYKLSSRANLFLVIFLLSCLLATACCDCLKFPSSLVRRVSGANQFHTASSNINITRKNWQQPQIARLLSNH